jgi:hypothetical protein
MSKVLFPSIILALSSIGFISTDGFATQPLVTSHSNPVQESNQDTPAPSWVKLAPQGAEFSILFPATPKENVDKVQEDSVTIPMHAYELTVGEVLYFVLAIGGFVDKPDSSELIDLFFNNAYQIILGVTEKDAKQALPPNINQREIALGGYQGRQYESDCGPYKATKAGSCQVILRVYKTNRSVYVVGISGPKAKLSENQASKFLDSFSINQ